MNISWVDVDFWGPGGRFFRYARVWWKLTKSQKWSKFKRRYLKLKLMRRQFQNDIILKDISFSSWVIAPDVFWTRIIFAYVRRRSSAIGSYFWTKYSLVSTQINRLGQLYHLKPFLLQICIEIRNVSPSTYFNTRQFYAKNVD